eukprot:scaffold33562_cov125-Skeletonema_dohrnii-CCMP3373.AAC.6
MRISPQHVIIYAIDVRWKTQQTNLTRSVHRDDMTTKADIRNILHLLGGREVPFDMLLRPT